MPIRRVILRDNRPDNNLFAAWVSSEDHFGAQPLSATSSPAASGARSPTAPPQPVSGREFQEPLVPISQAHDISRRISADASTQTRDLEPSAASRPPASEPSAAPQHAPPTSAAYAGASTPSHQEPATQSPTPPQPRRTRSQVGRDSYQLLWREYLALTADNQQHPRSTSRQRSSSAGRGRRLSPDTTTMAAAASTIVQGPLPYDRPKGLATLLVRVLCPPTDFLDMQKLTKLLIRALVGVSTLLVTLSFALVPAWLWLIRHELLEGHRGDAVAVMVGGLVTFVIADAVKAAASRAASTRRDGAFSAATKSAYQVAPGRYGSTSSAASKSTDGNPTSASEIAQRAGIRGAAAVGARTGAANGGLASPGTVDPLVRQVKHRIIKLEWLLFGNELTEGDISRDALHSRVHMLCTEVGVPCGGPGGSSARPGAAELDQQLQAVEKALGVQ